MHCFKINLKDKNFERLRIRESILKKKNSSKSVRKKTKDLGDLLVQYSIYKYFGISPNQWEIYYNEFGKPLVKSERDIYYSVSYSKDWILCIVSNKSIGIDVEYIKCIDYKSISEYFHDCENIQVNSAKDQLSEFYKIWTLKESYLKLLGTGLYKNLHDFNILKQHMYIDGQKVNILYKKMENYYISISSLQIIDHFRCEDITLENINEII